jgi:hypothetical protein
LRDAGISDQAKPISRPWQRFLRFSVRGMIVVVLVICGSLGWMVRSARIQREAVPAKPERGSNAARVAQTSLKPGPASTADRDLSVLEAVLKDLMTWPDGPFEDLEEANPTIFFSTERPHKWVSAGEMIDRVQLKLNREKVSGPQFQLAREAVKNLVRRQDDRDDLARFRPKDKRIVV